MFNGASMKKRILAFILCVCMFATCFAYSVADGEQYGDANGDGNISVSDASLILRYVVGLDNRMKTRGRMRGDVDMNGSVDAGDAAAILRHIAKLETINQVETDTELLKLLQKQSMLDNADILEWSTRFMQSISNEDVKSVFYAAATFIGTPYGKETDGKLDCSAFLKKAFELANIPKTKYPRSSSDGTLSWFKTNHPEQLHETDEFSWKDWKPGSVLIYVNQVTQKANHLSLYVGEIDGIPVVMESRSGGCDGVRIGRLMGSYYNSKSEYVELTHYVDPLG